MCKSHYLRFWRSLRRASVSACCAPCGAPVAADGRCLRHQESPLAKDPAPDSANSDPTRIPDLIEDRSREVSLTRALGKALRENAKLRERLAQLERARIVDSERLSERGRALRGGSTAAKRSFVRG
jgi:hypothetical protein